MHYEVERGIVGPWSVASSYARLLCWGGRST